MSGVIDSIERAQLRRVPAFQAGDRLRVHFQVVEGTRRRTQVFEGVVLKRQGSGARETFTVRKQSFGVGVERTFPVHSPKIERIEVAARGDVRRAKLYYLRDRVGRAARVRERRFTAEDQEALAAGAMPPPEADEAAVAGVEADPRDEGVEEVAEQVARDTDREDAAGAEHQAADTDREDAGGAEPQVADAGGDAQAGGAAQDAEAAAPGDAETADSAGA